MSAPACPDCGNLLRRVRNEGGVLNNDQFDSVRAGDWFCNQCKGDRGKSGHRYFWERELAPVATPRRPSRDCPHGEPLGWAHCPVCRAEPATTAAPPSGPSMPVLREMLDAAEAAVDQNKDPWDGATAEIPLDLLRRFADSVMPCGHPVEGNWQDDDGLISCSGCEQACVDEALATPAALERAVRKALCDMRRTWNPCGKKHHATCLASTDIADRVLAALRTVELEAVVEAARLRVLLAAVVNAADKDVGIVVINEDEHGVTSIDCPSCGAKGKELCRKDCSRNHLLGALDDAALALAAPPSAGAAELQELVAALAPAFGKVGYHLDHMDRVRSAHAALLAALPALKEAP